MSSCQARSHPSSRPQGGPRADHRIAQFGTTPRYYWSDQDRCSIDPLSDCVEFTGLSPSSILPEPSAFAPHRLVVISGHVPAACPSRPTRDRRARVAGHPSIDATCRDHKNDGQRREDLSGHFLSVGFATAQTLELSNAASPQSRLEKEGLEDRACGKTSGDAD